MNRPPIRQQSERSHNLIRPDVHQDEESAAESGGSFSADHQYRGDQRPMSKQKEALASAHFKQHLLTDVLFISSAY